MNRPLGRYLASVAHVAGLRPNHLTLASAVFSAVGIVVLAAARPATWPVAIVVSTCLVFGYALDSADGQLARLTGQSSASGEWLDHMIDAAKSPSIHLAVAVHLYRNDATTDALLLVPVLYAVVEVIKFSSMILRDLLTRSAAPLRPSPTSEHSWTYLVARLPQDYGLLCLVFLLLSTELFVIVYVSLFAANGLYATAAWPGWFRQMAALDDRSASS